jgi:hypothetical protein
MPDASVEAIRATAERLLNDPSFRAAADRLGDLVAAEAENTTVVQDLEAAAARGNTSTRRLRAQTLEMVA